jgi:WD40 repeat protein
LLFAIATLVTSAAAQPAKTPRLDLHGDPLPEGAIARLGTVRFQPRENDFSDDRFRFMTPRAIALSPDGTVLASAARDEKPGVRIDFMDTSTGKSRRRLTLAKPGGQIQFTPDGKSLVFGDWSGVTLIDALTGETSKSIKIAVGSDALALQDCFALCADSNLVAAQLRKSAYDAPVGIWDMTTGKEVAVLPGRGASCNGLVFGPDGKRLLLWSVVPTSVSNGSGMSFDSNSKVALACIDVEQRKIVGETTLKTTQHVALCPDGETVAVESADHQAIHIRHLPTGAERCVIPLQLAKFAFTPDGKTLFTIDEHGWGALWDAAKGEKIRDLDGALANKDFRIIGIANDGKTIAVLDGGWQSAPTVVVWNAATGQRVERPPSHEGAITCIAYAPGGKLLVSGSVDRTVRLWDAVTGKHVRKLADHTEEITAVAVSADGKLLASASKNGAVHISNLADGKAFADFFGPERGATALTFSLDGKTVFAGGHDPQVLAWHIAGARETTRLRTGDQGSVMALASGGALALVANGELRFFDETQEHLHIWNPSNKVPLTSMPIRHEKGGSVRCDAATFSIDGRMVASSQISEYQGIRPSYGAALLRVWERASGQPIRTLSPTITTLLAFSPNGRLLASGGAGQSGHLRVGYGAGIDIWDTLTGEKAGTLAVTPRCAAFSPDGLHLATGGRDHAIVIWKAPQAPSPNESKFPAAPNRDVPERDAWWTGLGGEAKDAYKTMEQMIVAPEPAVALLKERVEPVRSADPETVARLIVQLDSDTFAERAKAQAALEKMGEGAAHLLQKAREGNANLELGRRLEALLRRCEATSTMGLRHHRAIATLEWIATPNARALLQTLAEGTPGARLTIEAQAALKRMGD